MGQGSITFNREVLAALTFPRLLETDAISECAKNRASLYMNKTFSPLGAYTSSSKGFGYVRQCVAEYISRRDGIDLSEVDPENIFMTNGASEGVRLGFSSLVRNANDGILVPIPQYPLYSALLTLNGGELLPYYLDEEKGWSLN